MTNASEVEVGENVVVATGAVQPSLWQAFAWVLVGSATASIVTKAPGPGLIQFLTWILITAITLILSLPLAAFFARVADRKWRWSLSFGQSYRIVAVSQLASMIPPMIFTAIAPAHLVGDLAVATAVSAVGNILSPVIWSSTTVGELSVGWRRASQASVVLVPLLLFQFIWLLLMKVVLKV
jgi:hypothetical protein